MPPATPPRTRRPPPPFRRLVVHSVDARSPHMRRVVAGGDELEGFSIEEPAASVRLLLPSAGSLVIPSWTGNQWEHDDGSRPPVRTMTPRAFDAEARELTLDIVLHERGAAPDWVRAAVPGDEIAISGPAAGFRYDEADESYLLAGDETALPAIGQLLEWLPPHAAIDVQVEIGAADARQELPAHPLADIHWHVARQDSTPGTAFAEAVEDADELPDAVWVAGEAAAVQRVRRHLFETRGLPRSRVTARGYWKHGRSAT